MAVDKDKAKERNEARKRAKAPVEKPRSKKGYATQATDTAPRAAGRASRSKKKASPGEQGAQAKGPRRKHLEE